MKAEIVKVDSPIWQEVLAQIRHDVYHLPGYLAIEADRNDCLAEAFIYNDGGKTCFVPYLIRSCHTIAPGYLKDGELFDVISPYGYPSLLLSEMAINTPGFADAAMQEFKTTLQSKNVCSAFIRLHPILSDGFEQIFAPDTFTDNGETISVDLSLSNEEIWSHTRKGHRYTINRCKRHGFEARILPLNDHINEFMEVYQETMDRVDAKSFYYFDRPYVEALAKLKEAVHLCLVELHGEVASACLLFECDGIVQAHLGGTKDKYTQESPFSLVFDYTRYWAKERGNQWFHIGGGVGGSKDSLHSFKTGFSRQRHNFLTLRAIVDREKYDFLANCRCQALKTSLTELTSSNFFPVYRAL